MAQETPIPAPGDAEYAAMTEMIYGLINTQLVYVVAKLGIAELLADGAKSVDELAAMTGAHAPTLRRVLRLLATKEVFTQLDEDRFASNARAGCLRSDVPRSLKPMAEYYGSHWNWTSWSNLLEAVRTGRTAFDIAHSMSLFTYLEQHPEDGAVFDRYMTAIPTWPTQAVAAAYDFSDKRLVIDVGGGLGAFLTAILERNPGVRGVLFDLPDVLARARQAIATTTVADRFEFVAGDMFESVPRGGDVYIFSNIIHDWDDERAIRVLRNCRRAMSDGSVLLIREQVLPEEAPPAPAVRTDVVMLVLTGGKQRSESEFRSLLANADLRLARVLPLEAGGALIEAVPVQSHASGVPRHESP